MLGVYHLLCPPGLRIALMIEGAVAYSLTRALWRRLRRWRQGSSVAVLDASRSTTSSAGGGVGAYESRKAVDEYLQFHFGQPDEIMPYDIGPNVGDSERWLAWGKRIWMGDPGFLADILSIA